MKKIALILGLIFLSGCVSLEHLPEHIAGTYVRQPEEGTAGHYTKTFKMPYQICYDKAVVALKEMGASIRYENKRKKEILAWYFDKIYDKCIDTTKVTISFEEITPQKTKVHVACGNYGLAKFASTELFNRLPDRGGQEGGRNRN